MSSVNRIVISGNLTRDPELRMIPSGKSVCKFSVAVNGWKDEVSYVDCEAWEKTAEVIAEHLSKGSAVAVDGQIKQDRWEKDGQKRSTIFIRAQNVTFLGGRQEREAVGASAPSGDSDIPF